MREYVMYEVTHGKLICEDGRRWSWSRKEAIEIYKKEGPVIDAYMHECEYLIGRVLEKDIQVKADYIVDGDGGVIGTRIIMQVDDTTVNFNDYDARTISSVLNEGIAEAGRNLVKLGAHSKPETVSFVRGDLDAAHDSISFKSDSAYRIANELRGSGLLSEGITLYASADGVIKVDPIVDKPTVTVQDGETKINAVFHQITGGYTSKINIVSNTNGGKKIGRTTDLRIKNEHKKSLCYAMGDNAVVELVVKAEKRVSAGFETVAGYELIRIIEIVDQKDGLNYLN